MKPSRGFTLLEVVIAFAILALALTILMSSLGDAMGGVRWAAQDQRALAWAESHLEQLGRFGTLELGERQGEWEDGRYRYIERVKLVRDPQPFTPPPDAPQPVAPTQVLVQIELDVRWGSGEGRESLALRSLRVRSAADYSADALSK